MAKISGFPKNRKYGVQTVRLDELNNIITGATISYYFSKLNNVLKCCQSPAHCWKNAVFLPINRSFPYIAEKIQYFNGRCDVVEEDFCIFIFS
jgi:hypothetical protein